jgi:uncharacterized protein
MADSIPDILREEHRLRRHIRDLQAEIDRGPRVTKAHQDKVDRQQKALQAEQDLVKKLKVAIQALEVTIKQTNTQIAKARKQLEELSDQRQIEAKEHEITHCETLLATTEEEILLKMAELEEHSVKVPVCEADFKKGQEDFSKYQAEAAERMKRLQAEKKLAETELLKVDGKVPILIKPYLDRITKAHGADAFASVQNRVCSHCQAELTQQLTNELLNKLFVCCKSCGRALYPI